jgi:hypothetical protein
LFPRADILPRVLGILQWAGQHLDILNIIQTLVINVMLLMPENSTMGTAPDEGLQVSRRP